MNIKVYHTINLLIAFALIIDGLYWMVTAFKSIEDTLGFGGGSAVLVGFPMFKGIVLPIQPISILILGVFMLGLDQYHPKIAIPLWLMGAGIFDIIGDLQLGMRFYHFDYWLAFELFLMLTGWLLAGRPRFFVNRWLWLSGLVFIVSIPTNSRFFEVALFTYIVTSTSRIPR